MKILKVPIVAFYKLFLFVGIVYRLLVFFIATYHNCGLLFVLSVIKIEA